MFSQCTWLAAHTIILYPFVFSLLSTIPNSLSFFDNSNCYYFQVRVFIILPGRMDNLVSDICLKTVLFSIWVSMVVGEIIHARACSLTSKTMAGFASTTNSERFLAGAKHILQDYMCTQRGLRSVCTSTHTLQSLQCPLKDALDPWLTTA